jgi:hypothetical protein
MIVSNIEQERTKELFEKKNKFISCHICEEKEIIANTGFVK